MTTPAKLYGKDLSEYDDIDVEALLAQLSSEEIQLLAKEVDPDVSYQDIKMNCLIHVYFKFAHRINFYHQVNVIATNAPNHQQDRWIVKN